MAAAAEGVRAAAAGVVAEIEKVDGLFPPVCAKCPRAGAPTYLPQAADNRPLPLRLYVPLLPALLPRRKAC